MEDAKFTFTFSSV